MFVVAVIQLAMMGLSLHVLMSFIKSQVVDPHWGSLLFFFLEGTR
jgi:hypothetical protein